MTIRRITPRGMAAGCRRAGVGLVAAAALAAPIAVAATLARAEEPRGCAAFRWPLGEEAKRLQAADGPAPDAAKADGAAYALKLVPLDEAHLPLRPERKPKVTPSNAGFVAFAAPPGAGSYQVAITVAAWIDIVQEGGYVHPSAFSGATDCPGVRKSIRFDLAAKPFVVQISGTDAAATALLVEPATAAPAKP